MGKKKSKEVVEEKPVRQQEPPKKKVLPKRLVKEPVQVAPPPPPPEPAPPKKRTRRQKTVATLTEDIKKELTAQNKPKVVKPSVHEYRNIPKPNVEKGEGMSIVFSSDRLTISKFTKSKEAKLRDWVYKTALEYDIEGLGLWIKEYSIKIQIKNRFHSDPLNFEYIGATAYMIVKMFEMSIKGLTITIKGE